MSKCVTFCLSPGGQTIFTHRWGQTFFVGGDGGDDDVDCEKDEDVSEASKLSAVATFLRGPQGPEILVIN